MNKILLVLTILGAGGGVFFTARQSTTRLQNEANATREAWLAQTQLVSVEHSDQAGLIVSIRELKQALTQPQPVRENALWSAFQTNQLTSELRERLLEELGFNWQSSEEFVVVSKEALREIQMQAFYYGELSDNAATVLAMTHEEREQVEAAVQQVRTDFRGWVSTHTERSEPKDDVVAQYTYTQQLNSAMRLNISNNFATAVFGALGKQRAELILPSAWDWMVIMGIHDKPTTLIVRRYSVGNEQRLNVQQTGDAEPKDLGFFPRAFRSLFPNGWKDMAQREGFELPKEVQKK